MPWALRHEKFRVVPFSFGRATADTPSAGFPAVDDRGHRGPTFGGIFPLSEGVDEAVLKIFSHLPGRVRVGLTASNNTFRILNSPVEFEFEDEELIRIAPSYGSSQEGVLEVRAGGVTGPIVAKLTVRRFYWQFIVPFVHIVQLFNTAGSGNVPSPNGLVAAFRNAATIWKPCGIAIADPIIDTPNVHRVRSSHTDALHLPNHYPSTNLNNVLNSVHHNGVLNVYLVDRIQLGTNELLGFGTDRALVAAHLVPRRGLLLEPPRSVEEHGGVIAHELGHVLGLEHVRNMSIPNADGSTYSLRQLMHATSPPANPTNWPSPPQRVTVTRPRFSDVGFGTAQLGALITLKTLPHVPADNQANTATTELRNHPF